MLKVIAFDLFGTVFDMQNTTRQDLKDYTYHIKQPYSPLTLPETWTRLNPFPDSRTGLDRISKKYKIVTASNAPFALTIRLLWNSGIHFDGIIPFEIIQTFKPNPDAYKLIPKLCGCEPSEVMMVTANKDFGDLEGAAAVGMHTQLIRSEIKNIIKLAEKLK